MTTRTLTVLTVFVLILTMLTACNPSAANMGNNVTTTTLTSATTTTAPNDLFGGTTTTDTNVDTTAETISAEQAQAIALKDAGLTVDDVTGLRTELERDDGKLHYDVQFYQGATEYDYDIDAAGGEILEKDRDIEG